MITLLDRDDCCRRCGRDNRSTCYVDFIGDRVDDSHSGCCDSDRRCRNRSPTWSQPNENRSRMSTWHSRRTRGRGITKERRAICSFGCDVWLIAGGASDLRTVSASTYMASTFSVNYRSQAVVGIACCTLEYVWPEVDGLRGSIDADQLQSKEC